MKRGAWKSNPASLRVALTLIVALLVFVSLVVGAGAVPAKSPAASSGILPNILLPAAASGSAAVEALGVHLPDVAKAYGLTSAELTQRFQSDKHLSVDQKGHLFYNEAFPTGSSASGAATASDYGRAPAMAPLADTFLLHSLPGAQRVIYLDFDGQVLSHDVWTDGYNGGADIVAPPFDIDGNPGAFSDTELTRIQQVWQRVAEDYAPFAVDVTTEYPGEAAITRSSSSDLNYGMRVLISPMSSYVGNYGGVAYVGIFDMVGDYYKPALVFPEKLANGEKYIGEASSHENGHTLGLYHDGTTSGTEYYAGHGSGVTGWAPIMGNGYYQNLTQWSKGEYAGANNTEDDLAKMAQRGIPYRSDDHGNSPAAATVFAGSGQLSASGLIGRTGDADVFALTSGAGNLTVNVSPAERGPNLDISLELLDAGGSVVASSNPLDLLTAGLSVTVAQGTYYVAVHGTGKVDPLATGYTGYASLGWYALSATVPTPSGNLSPVAVIDATPTGGEAPLTVVFDASGSYDPDGIITSHSWDFGDGTTTQGAQASHVFVSPGIYVVTLTVTDSQGASGSATMTINVEAGNVAPTAVASASPLSGVAPLLVIFDGTGSYDSDGSVVSYGWTFGDGSTATGFVAQHTYASPGTYTAWLTVIDDRGATGSTSLTITVQQDPAKVMRVASVEVTVLSVRGGLQAQAKVKIVDANGQAVSGALVSGRFGGSVLGSASGTTDSTGTATILSKKFKARGTPTVTFSVSGVSKTGYVYNPS